MMKKLLLTLVGVICSLGMWATDNISCSAYLSGTAGTPTVSNCALAFYGQDGQAASDVPAGTASGSYYYSKMNNDVNYYQITLNQTVGTNNYTSFQAGDKLTVYLYGNSTTAGYFVGKTAQTTVTSTITKGAVCTVEHTLTAAEIESDGTVRIYRNGSNTYFAGAAVTGTRKSSSDYDITFDAGEGTGTMEATYATVGTIITLPASTFTSPANKMFSKWLCSVDSKEYAAGAEYTMTAAATTFTAQYVNAAGSLVKAEYLDNTSATVTTSIGCTADVNMSGAKMQTGRYFGIKTPDNQTFKTGDVVKLHFTTAGSTNGWYVFNSSNASEDNLIYSSTTGGNQNDLQFTLTSDQKAIYLVRASSGDYSSWNPTLGSIEVERPTYHSITYAETKGADISAYPTQYQEGVGVASFDALPDVEGYKFKGWSPASISTTDNTDMTITAQWSAAYTVTFDLQGKGTNFTQGVVSGEKATKPTDPTNGAYTFAGWTTTAEGGTAFDFNEPILGNITAYAQWTAKPASTSVNIEQNVLDNSKKWDFATALKNANIAYVDNDALDSLDNTKTSRNEAFLGLKFKKATSSFTVVLPAGQTVKVKFGNIGNQINVSGLTTAAIATDADKVYTFKNETSERGYLTFANSAASTVVLKQIQIGVNPSIADVILPAQYETITPNANGVASYVTTLGLDFTDVSGLTAYLATATDGTNHTITLEKATVVPAGTALVVKVTALTEYSIPTSSSKAAVTNLFLAADGVKSASQYGNNVYCLNTEGNFQKVGGSVVIPPGKAYIATSETLAKIVSSDFGFIGDVTGVNNVEANVAAQNSTKKAIVNGRLVIKTANGTFNAAGAQMK